MEQIKRVSIVKLKPALRYAKSGRMSSHNHYESYERLQSEIKTLEQKVSILSRHLVKAELNLLSCEEDTDGRLKGLFEIFLEERKHDRKYYFKYKEHSFGREMLKQEINGEYVWWTNQLRDEHTKMKEKEAKEREEKRNGEN